MTSGILVECELQIPQVTWRVIKGFAGSRRLKFSRQRAVHIVRCFLKEYDVSKGTIRLPWNKELPTELIQKIARWCYENYSGWQKAEIEPMNVVLVNGEKRA